MAVIRFHGSSTRRIWTIEEIYHTYINQMYALAFSMLHNQMEAEDAVHDVFVRVASNLSILEKIPTQDDMRNYLLKATKNTALNMIRKKNHEAIYSETAGSERKSIPSLSDDEFVESIFRKAAYGEIVQAILNMDNKYSDVLYCHFVLELTVPETAKVLGRNISTVKQQLVRGKKMLLSSLEHQKGAGHVGR